MKNNFYSKNKPLIYSSITGLLYFLFLTLTVPKEIGMAVLMFLPGFTFPVATCYFNRENIKKENEISTILLHLIISVGIYHGSVWIFSGHVHTDYMAFCGGFVGSFLFLLVSRFFLKMNLSWFSIIITSVLSGLSFIIFDITDGGIENLLGYSILSWTIINGFLLNIEYRTRMSLFNKTLRVEMESFHNEE